MVDSAGNIFCRRQCTIKILVEETKLDNRLDSEYNIFMLKTCTLCGQEKLEDDFYWKVKGKYRQYRCKACQSKYAKAHYLENKKIYQDRATKYRQTRQGFIGKYLSERGCIDCGITDIRVLDTDHIAGTKVASAAKMIENGWSFDSMTEELSKCEIRCKNCHATRHAKESNNWRNKLYMSL